MSRTVLAHDDLELRAEAGRLEELSSVVEAIVRTVRADFETDRRLEALLRDDSGTKYLERRDAVDREMPEPFTRTRLVEELLATLGFAELSHRPEDVTDGRGEGTDYSARIGSERVLIETEPLNGDLDRLGAAIDRMKRWLESRRFDARYGIATDGIRWVLLGYDETSCDFDTLADVSLREVFVRQFESLAGRTNSPAPSTPDASDDSGDEALLRLARFFDRDNLQTIVTRADDVVRARRRRITEEFYEEYVQRVFGVVDEETGETTGRSLVRGGVDVPESVDEAVENPRRLFSVSLVNRLVFVRFLEDRGLVRENLLQELRAAYEESTRQDGFYSAYLHPLFYREFDRTRGDCEGRAAEFFDEALPPNGELFRPILAHEVDVGEREYTTDQLVELERRFEVDDSVLFDVVDLLERYRFATGGGTGTLEDRDVESLDPSALGTVFEKTINYLAGETGKQKDLGAFYTPDEITRFTATETIRPIALERLETALRERGCQDAEVDRYEDVEAVVADLPPSPDLEAALQRALDTLSVCDPACGSGHFLTAVLDEVMTIRKAVARNGREGPLSGRDAMELKRRTIRENVYGVDVVAPAVEIARLRLWLSVIDDLDPEGVAGPNDAEIALPDVTFNVRVGNSLVGFPDLENRRDDGKPALAEIEDWREASIESVDAAFAERVSDVSFEDRRAIEAIGDVDETVRRLADAADDAAVSSVGFYVDRNHPLTDAPQSYTDETLDGLEFTAHTWKAKRLVSNGLSDGDLEALVDAVRSHPEEGVAEVYVERTMTNGDLDALSRFHWPVEFPDVAKSTGDGESATFGFDVVIGNPPFGAEINGLEADLVDRDEFFTCQGANNSAEYFLERAVQLTRPGGRVGFVLPKTLGYYTTWGDIRSKLLGECPPVALFDNGLAFPGVNYEQVTLVATPTDDEDDQLGNREVDAYVAEDLRDETANDPVHAGSVPLDVMRSRGTLVLRPLTERDRDIVAALETDTTPLGDLWAREPWRGVYVPDSRKAALDEGETPFLERVPSVQRYYLEAEGIWHVDVDDLPENRRANAIETMTPRLLFKVLRGSRLYVYPDVTGRFASTEKLVNVPVRTGATSHTLRSLAAVLNAPVVSYYLQKLLFSETTETARVMDADYVRGIPIPVVTERQARILDAVAEHLLFAAQYADDGHGGGRAREHVAFLERLADALVADLYFECGDDDLWEAVGGALSPIAFDEWADARFAAGDYPIERARSRWKAVENGVDALSEAGVHETVERIESHELVGRVVDVLDG